MSEAPEPGSRDHEPSEKKVADAVERGETPVAHDLKVLGSVVGVYVALRLMRQVSLESQIGILRGMIDHSWDFRLRNGFDAAEIGYALCAAVIGPWAAIVLASLAASVAIGSVSQRPRIIWRRLKIDLSRLDLMKGAKRLFGRDALTAFAKMLAKNVIIGCGIWIATRDGWRQIVTHQQPGMVAANILDCLERVTHTVAAVLVGFAMLELVTSRIGWRKSLRMTRQEVKDELKQSEGDPLVRIRMRSIALNRARKRMLNEVSSATMVVANPTHFAVAMRYLREEGGAPVVVAKGQELIALKIRAEAEQRKIPVFEQPELARAMYRSVEVGQSIPPEFYKAIAEIVNYLATCGQSRIFTPEQVSNKAM